MYGMGKASAGWGARVCHPTCSDASLDASTAAPGRLPARLNSSLACLEWRAACAVCVVVSLWLRYVRPWRWRTSGNPTCSIQRSGFDCLLACGAWQGSKPRCSYLARIPIDIQVVFNIQAPSAHASTGSCTAALLGSSSSESNRVHFIVMTALVVCGTYSASTRSVSSFLRRAVPRRMSFRGPKRSLGCILCATACTPEFKHDAWPL